MLTAYEGGRTALFMSFVHDTGADLMHAPSMHFHAEQVDGNVRLLALKLSNLGHRMRNGAK